MRYKPYLSVTHTLTNSISRLLFFYESKCCLLSRYCGSPRTDCGEHRGALLCRGLLLASVLFFFSEPVLPICLISKRHANLRSLQRTASESQVRWGYQTSQRARLKKRQQKQSVGPGLSFQMHKSPEWVSCEYTELQYVLPTRADIQPSSHIMLKVSRTMTNKI